MPHYHDPAQALVKEAAHGLIIGDRLHGIGEQFHFVTQVGNQTAHQKVIRRPVLNCLVTAELRQARARGGNRRPQRELDAVQLPGYQNAGIEIGNHSDGLQFFREGIFVGGHVKTRYSPNRGVGQRRNNGAQIVRADAHIAVADHEIFVLCLARQRNQFCHLVVAGAAPGIEQHADSPLREFAGQPFHDRQRRIIAPPDAE